VVRGAQLALRAIRKIRMIRKPSFLMLMRRRDRYQTRNCRSLTLVARFKREIQLAATLQHLTLAIVPV